MILWEDSKSSAHARGSFWERLDSASEDDSSDVEICSQGGKSEDESSSVSSEDLEEQANTSSSSSCTLVPISR